MTSALALARPTPASGTATDAPGELVATVRGPVASSHLGAVLMHEHVFLIDPHLRDEFPGLVWDGERSAKIEAARDLLREVKARGFDTIVDCTAPGLGRNIRDIQEVNAGVDLNIVVATGFYTVADIPFVFESYPNEARRPGTASTDVLVELFVREIEDGIADTGVRAGVVKCCTDVGGLTPGVERVLRAAAWAHRSTGVVITTHTAAEQRAGLAQQRVLAEEGVDLSRVVIGHSGDTTDLDYLRELMDRGSTIGADRFGCYGGSSPGLTERVDVVARLCSEGYSDRIVMSHDAHCYADWRHRRSPFGGQPPEWVMTHIADAVLPALRAANVTEEQINALLVDNPRRLLARGPSY